MKTARIFLLLGLGLFVSACASVEVPSRNALSEPLPSVAGALVAVVPGQSPVSVNSVVVRVPGSLKVSEANLFLPNSDIVWRGEPIGDRHAQVQKIFQDAMTKGVASLSGPVKVDIDIQVRRFHALTQRARYTVGGVHSITFDLAIKDLKTGALLMPVRTVRADLNGFGGSRALAAEARGQTQKVRISDHLAEVIRQELSNPEGYKNASLGFMQALNNM